MNKFKIINPLLFAIFILFATQNFRAQQPTVDTVKNEPEKKYFELSLGQSLLFITNTKLQEIRTKASVIVPTNAVLFFAEFRPTKLIRLPVFINVPTETKQFLVDNQLVFERASPTFGAGIQFRIFTFAIGKKSAVEMEAGPLASFLLSEKNVIRFAPIGAGRFRFIKNKDFVLYIGGSYSAGINAFGVLFGTGYIF